MEKGDVRIVVKNLSKNLLVRSFGFPLNALLSTIYDCKNEKELADKFDEINHYAKLLSSGLVVEENATENEVRIVNFIVIRTVEDLSEDKNIGETIKSWFESIDNDGAFMYQPVSVEITGNEILMPFERLERGDAKDLVEKMEEELSNEEITVKSVSYY